MASGNGTLHHRLHGITGLVTIMTLPVVLAGLIMFAGDGFSGLTTWLGTAWGAIGAMLFLTAAMWYARLELDEVILDYFGGGTQKFLLLAVKLVMFVAWAMAVFAIFKLWLGA